MLSLFLPVYYSVTILNYLVISFKLLQKGNKFFKASSDIVILLLDNLSNAQRASPHDHGEQRIRGIFSQNYIWCI